MRFRALAEAALAAAEGKPIGDVAEAALAAATAYIGLAAGALILLDSNGQEIIRKVVSNSPENKALLERTDRGVLSRLREESKVFTAYLEMKEEAYKSVFSLPVEMPTRPFGVLIGVKLGKARLPEYDKFLRSLAAVLALAMAEPGAFEDLAAGANHEINNLLTPLTGYVDLLVKDAEKLPPSDVRRKLELIQEQAGKITDVTARMKDAPKLPRVPYPDGGWMVKLSGEDAEDSDASSGGESSKT